MAQSVMLACVEKRFGDIKTLYPVEWLSDNDSCYTSRKTIAFAAHLGIISNGMAEALVKHSNGITSSVMIGLTQKL